MKIKTILFDLDGTLIDSRADLASAVNFALESVGRSRKTQDEIIPHVGNGLRDLLTDVMGPVSDKILDTAITSFSSYYAEHCTDQTVPYMGVQDVLGDLHSHMLIGVVTNKPYVFSQQIIEHLGLASFISVVIGGDTLSERKPHPAPVIKAVEALGGNTKTTFFLGDGHQDIQAGQAAGTVTCIARYGFGFRPETLNLKPNFQINSFSELKEIVS